MVQRAAGQPVARFFKDEKMSDLTDFTSAGFDVFSAVNGTETLTIDGGSAVAGIQNEDRRVRDWESGGWDEEASLLLVIDRADWLAGGYSADVKTYQGKLATVGSRSMRVAATSIGIGFVEIGLGDAEEAK